MISWWQKIFGTCLACEARDYTIMLLKEQLHARDEENEILHNQIEHLVDGQYDIIKHITGMNRVQSNTGQPSELHSIQRKSGGIQERIKRAEQAEKDPVLMTQRKKEYEDRI